MKNLVIGLIVGALLAVCVLELLPKTQEPEQGNNSVKSPETVSEQIEEKASAIEYENNFSYEEPDNINSLSRSVNVDDSLARTPETIDEYKLLVSDMRDALSQQANVIERLSEEKDKLEKQNDELSRGGGELVELTSGQIETAKQNMTALIPDASEEYAEVLAAALKHHNATKSISPGSEALMRHYSDELDYVWSELAEVYIKNYFAGYADQNIQLIQLNCRKTYCELYGFYSSNQPITDPLTGAAEVSKVFQTMEQDPGFDALFTGVESSSLSVNSENSYMTFHNFLRSNN